MVRTQKKTSETLTPYSYQWQLIVLSSRSLDYPDAPRNQPEQHSQRATQITHEGEKGAVLRQRSTQHAEQNNQVNTAKETDGLETMKEVVN